MDILICYIFTIFAVCYWNILINRRYDSILSISNKDLKMFKSSFGCLVKPLHSNPKHWMDGMLVRAGK